MRPSPVITVSINGGHSGLDCFALLAMTGRRLHVSLFAICNLDAVIASVAKQSRGLTYGMDCRVAFGSSQ